MYNHVALELTSSIFPADQNTPYDVPFFIVFPFNDVKHIAFQHDLNLVIYHENARLVIPNE